MPGEEHGEVEDHADHCGGDAGKRGGELEISVRGLDQRPADQDEKIGRQESEISGNGAAGYPGPERGQRIRPEDLLGPAADEADIGHDHDQRPGRGLAQREAVYHLRRGEPAVGLHAALVHVGQHGIGAAEGQQRRLGEEPSDLRQRPVPAVPSVEPGHHTGPEREARGSEADEALPGEARVRRRGRVVVDDRRTIALAGCAVPAAGGELARGQAPADGADDAGCQHDVREGDLESEDGDEGRGADRPQHAVLERARADAVRGEYDNGGDRRLDAVEDARHQRHLAEHQIDPGQRHQEEHGGQHEQHAGDDAAPGPVHHPADIGGELGGLRPGQQHAIVERMQEALLRDPAPFLHQVLVHDGDLPGGAAEADEAELEPVAEGLSETHRRGGLLRVLGHDCFLVSQGQAMRSILGRSRVTHLEFEC